MYELTLVLPQFAIFLCNDCILWTFLVPKENKFFMLKAIEKIA